MSEENKFCPYRVLGVNIDATKQEIKKAFKKLSLKHHPDQNKGKESKMFHDIQAAYKLLTSEGDMFIFEVTGIRVDSKII